MKTRIIIFITGVIAAILVYTFLLKKGSPPFYSLELLDVNKELVSHFPISLESKAVFSKGNNIGEQCVFYRLLIPNVSSEKLDEVITKAKKESVGIYRANDTRLITIKYKSTIRSRGLVLEKVQNICNKDSCYYPIPFFVMASEEFLPTYARNSKSGLTDDCTIYVLNSKPGIYWDGLDGISYMPTGWKHGYSKGYVVSEKQKSLTYWFVTW